MLYFIYNSKLSIKIKQKKLDGIWNKFQLVKNLKIRNYPTIKMKKSINQFDYPTRDAQDFKSFSQNAYQETQALTNYQKTKYKENLQYHKQLERQKTKQIQRKKKQLEIKKNKAKIAEELQKKKRQLQRLEFLKQQAEQNQRKSYQLALAKEQQDIIRKEEEQRKKKENQLNAQNRFQSALQRLYIEKEQNSFKERLAQQRRKTAQQFQKIQRIKANKYKSIVEEREKNQPIKQMRTFEEYKQTLGRSAYNKNTDYNKTCLHNPKIIVENKNNPVDEDAFKRGIQTNKQIEQRLEEKRKEMDAHVRKSKERGQAALLKMQRQKEYHQFQKQSEQEQIKYNLSRIEAGKKNQFIGVKPQTLNQMEQNKKQRSEQQFAKMFFKKPITATQNFNKTASNFEIVETRMPQKSSNTSVCTVPKKSIKHSYLRQKEQSQIPCVSEGKYSFQEPQYSQFRNYSRSQDEIVNGGYNQHENQQQEPYNVKNAWKETGIPNQKYNSSPENSRQPVYPFSTGLGPQQTVKNVLQESQKKYVEQKSSFNTDEMMRKYGLKKDSPQRGNKPKSQKKRKVVQLANICQNKDLSKEQLNYSSESEEDSLM